MDKRIKELRGKAKHLEPVLNIGKNGLTQGSIDLIERELEQRQLIKVKFNKGAIGEGSKKERQELAARIAQATDAKVIELVGNILVLYRP